MTPARNSLMHEEMVPSYYHQFRCIGGDCEDNCCAGWNVNIDPATYERYKQLLDPKMLHNAFESTLNENGYRIRMQGDDQRCPLQDPDGYCSIQRNLGESLLSRICATYPRRLNRVAGVYERSLRPSCPEAARLILQPADGIRWSAEQRPIETRLSVSHNVDNPLLGNAVWTICDAAISLLQDRNYDIETRLLALAGLTQQLGPILTVANPETAVAACCKCHDRYRNGAFRRRLQQTEPDSGLQLHTFAAQVQPAVASMINNTRFTEVFRQFTDTVQLGRRVEGRAVEQYRNAILHRYRIRKRRIDQMLENYLVNYCKVHVFPFVGDDSPFAVYQRMILNFGIIRTLLIGLGQEKMGAYEEDVVRVVSSFSKAIEHNHELVEALLKGIQAQENADKLTHVSVLLRLVE